MRPAASGRSNFRATTCRVPADTPDPYHADRHQRFQGELLDRPVKNSGHTHPGTRTSEIGSKMRVTCGSPSFLGLRRLNSGGALFTSAWRRASFSFARLPGALLSINPLGPRSLSRSPVSDKLHRHTAKPSSFCARTAIVDRRKRTQTTGRICIPRLPRQPSQRQSIEIPP